MFPDRAVGGLLKGRYSTTDPINAFHQIWFVGHFRRTDERGMNEEDTGGGGM